MLEIEAEAKRLASRPRPRPKFGLEAQAEARRSRHRPRPMLRDGNQNFGLEASGQCGIEAFNISANFMKIDSRISE